MKGEKIKSRQDLISKEQNVTENMPEDIKKAVSILSKPKEQRILDDIIYLINKIEHHDFFSKIKSRTGINGDSSLLYSCAKVLGFKQLAKGEIICLKGETSDRFFVILGGAVNIFLPKDAISLENDKKSRKEYFSKKQQTQINALKAQLTLARKLSSLDENNQGGALTQEEEYLTEYFVSEAELGGLRLKDLKNPEVLFEEGTFMYNFGTTLKKGSIIGELGLIRNKPRAVTIICLENTYFATMSKIDYDQILRQVDDNKINTKIDFFVKSLFNNCSRDKIAKISYDFEKVSYKYKQTIYKENDESKEIYLIYKGSVKLTKEYSFIEQRRSLQDKQDILGFMRQTEKEKTITIQIADLTVGQCFGEDDMLKDRLRTVNAISMSQETKVYKINQQKFNKSILDKQILEVFKERALIKDEWRNKQLEQIKVKMKENDPQTYTLVFNEKIVDPQPNQEQRKVIANNIKVRSSAKEIIQRVKLLNDYEESVPPFSNNNNVNQEQKYHMNQNYMGFNNENRIKISQFRNDNRSNSYLLNLESIIKYNEVTLKKLSKDSTRINFDILIKEKKQKKIHFGSNKSQTTAGSRAPPRISKTSQSSKRKLAFSDHKKQVLFIQTEIPKNDEQQQQQNSPQDYIRKVRTFPTQQSSSNINMKLNNYINMLQHIKYAKENSSKIKTKDKSITNYQTIQVQERHISSIQSPMRLSNGTVYIGKFDDDQQLQYKEQPKKSIIQMTPVMFSNKKQKNCSISFSRHTPLPISNFQFMRMKKFLQKKKNQSENQIELNHLKK